MSDFNERQRAKDLLAKAKEMEKQFTSNSDYKRVKTDHRTTFLTKSDITPKEEPKVQKTAFITLDSDSFSTIVISRKIKADKDGLYFDSMLKGTPTRNSLEFSESAIEYLRKLLK